MYTDDDDDRLFSKIKTLAFGYGFFLIATSYKKPEQLFRRQTSLFSICFLNELFNDHTPKLRKKGYVNIEFWMK